MLYFNQKIGIGTNTELTPQTSPATLQMLCSEREAGGSPGREVNGGVDWRENKHGSEGSSLLEMKDTWFKGKQGKNISQEKRQLCEETNGKG